MQLQRLKVLGQLFSHYKCYSGLWMRSEDVLSSYDTKKSV